MAALQVVKKRRANHIQSWRSDKNGSHLPLIYTSTSQMGVFAPAPPAGTAPTTPAVNTSTAPAGTAPTPPAVNTLTAPAVAAPAPPAVNAPTVNVTVNFPPIMCDGACQRQLPEDHYPKGDVWGDNPKLYCQDCWDKQQANLVCEQVEDEQQRQKVLTSMTSTKDGTPPARKRRRLTKCKWCGSTTHLTKRSLKCPHNPRNVESSVQVPSQPETVDDGSSHSDDGSDGSSESEFDPFEDEDTTATPPAPTQPTPAPPQPTPTPPPEYHSFPRGGNALHTNGKEVRLIQVVEVCDDDNYNVYFVDDGKVKTVHASTLKPERYPTPLRREYLNLEWFFDGAEDLASGRWKVRRIVDNEFVCTRLTGDLPKHVSQNIENFDIGYVMNQIHTQHEFHRKRRRHR